MRYVIPDVHGCAQTLKTLVARLRLSPTDVLYFLGDYIDKGKNSAGVLDFILQLRQQYEVHTLRGNHEQNILETQVEYDRKLFRAFVAKINKSPDLLTAEDTIVPVYEDFMRGLPYYLELPDVWLVHAGFHTGAEDMLADKNYMLEGRKTVYDALKLKHKPVLHGHTVTYRSDIEKAVQTRASVIPLDNGCVYNKPHKMYDHTQTGHLCCLNLDTFELVWQENVEEL
ncbi:MAG: serine/threonine protein phosphatase [Bacteroidetes bacterium]|nr:MAG: serine/threonine protein phosphatase [Bacteroidota bacterium]